MKIIEHDNKNHQFGAVLELSASLLTQGIGGKRYEQFGRKMWI